MKLRAPGGLIDRLLKSGATDEQALSEIYLAALCRQPTAEERAKAVAVLRDTGSSAAGAPAEARRAVLEDLCWAVVTDREFLFNH
jgi:hypothetical protein